MTIEELAARLWKPKDELERGTPSAIYGPPLTAEMVRSAEEKLGVPLPTSYIEFMRIQNGGYLRLQETEIDGAYVDFRDLTGIGTDRGPENHSEYMIEEWGYPSPAVWLGGDGHTAILLDYRGLKPGDESPILWVDVEDDEPQERHLAPDFKSWLELLVEHAARS